MGVFSTICDAVRGATAAEAAWAERQHANGSYQVEYVKDGEHHTANVSRIAAGGLRTVARPGDDWLNTTYEARASFDPNADSCY